MLYGNSGIAESLLGAAGSVPEVPDSLITAISSLSNGSLLQSSRWQQHETDWHLDLLVPLKIMPIHADSAPNIPMPAKDHSATVALTIKSLILLYTDNNKNCV